jgi:aspartokinase
MCSSLAEGRVNVGLLTYLADNAIGESITAVSARSLFSFPGCTLEMAGTEMCEAAAIDNNVCRISLFPHDEKPEVTASAISAMDAGAVKPYTFASSPSAVTVVVSSSNFDGAMESIFDSFALPACVSYSEWRAVYRMDEQQLKEVRFSYSEQIIGIYGFTCQTGLDLWNIPLPIEYAGCFGAFLSKLGKLGLKLPFMISNSAPVKKSVLFSLALKRDRCGTIKETLDEFLPGNSFFFRGPVSVIFIHGPHFGDRYGIADAFVTALRNGGIPLLALSCAVSSISAVIDAEQPDKAIEALKARFQTRDGRR